jgi:hypothetical protein
LLKVGFVIGGGWREENGLMRFAVDQFWTMVIEMAIEILRAGMSATADAHEEVDKNVDRLVPVASGLAHAVSLRAYAVRGGGEIRASTGNGDDAQSGAMGDFLLPIHEGLQKNSKVITKLGVVFESLSKDEEIKRSPEWHLIGVKYMLDLDDVAVVTVERG